MLSKGWFLVLGMAVIFFLRARTQGKVMSSKDFLPTGYNYIQDLEIT